MEFDVSKVYTALNADELKVGSKVICADNLYVLKFSVDNELYITTLGEILPEDCMLRFRTKEGEEYALAYLVSGPEEKKLKKKYSHDCPSCVAFGKHCPHKVNGDPYFYDCYLTVKDLEKENAALERRIERAKRCMKKLMFIINSDPANYNCKGLMQDAEDFIHNRICNIRQLGEHCISETRCIMCDMEDKNE